MSTTSAGVFAVAAAMIVSRLDGVAAVAFGAGVLAVGVAEAVRVAKKRPAS